VAEAERERILERTRRFTTENIENGESRMATGINGKSKQNPRFLYSPDLLKKHT
jgi:hypothetical protein